MRVFNHNIRGGLNARSVQFGVVCREATEFQIDDSLVLVGAEIGVTAHETQLLREPRTLLARRLDRSFSRSISATPGCARRYRVGVGTNRQGLCYRRSRAPRYKGSDANCQPWGERCSHGCAPLHARHATRFCSVLPGNPHPASVFAAREISEAAPPVVTAARRNLTRALPAEGHEARFHRGMCLPKTISAISDGGVRLAQHQRR